MLGQQWWELLRPFARSLKLNGLKTQDIDYEQSVSFSSDLVRAMHARGAA